MRKHIGFIVSIIGTLLACSYRMDDNDNRQMPIVKNILGEAIGSLGKALKEVGYIYDITESLALYVDIMMDEEVQDILNESQKTRNLVMQNLVQVRKEGAIKIMQEETDKFRRQLKREGYSQVEIALVCADMSGGNLGDLNAAFRDMIHSGDVFNDIKYGGDIDMELRKRITKFQKKGKKISIPCLLTMSPRIDGEKRLFVTTIDFSFFCVKKSKGRIKTLHFDLYLDQLKPKKIGSFAYYWKVANVEYK